MLIGKIAGKVETLGVPAGTVFEFSHETICDILAIEEYGVFDGFGSKLNGLNDVDDDVGGCGM